MMIQFLQNRFLLTVIILQVTERCLGQFQRARPSPCQDVFSYEEQEPGSDRWYGDINLNVESMTQGAALRIALNKPSHLLVSWAGEVSSTDNTIYVAHHDNAVLENGVTYKIRIMVKYATSEPAPLLEGIHFNGKHICPPDAPLTLDGLGRPRGRDVTSPRPDLELPEPTDVSVERRTGEPAGGEVFADVPCGQVAMASALIIQGQRTQRGQWPWHVALYKTEGINLSYICGGSLVTKNKVITAAHCLVSNPGGRLINPKSLIAYFGKHSLRQYTGEQGVQTKEVSKISVSPDYNSTNFHGDIAVLTLFSDVQYTNFVRPICLWEATDTITDIIGKDGMVPGWGLDEHDQASEELKMAKLPVVSTETCFRSYPKFYSEYASEKSFCAGYRSGNSTISTSPCNGDSGGDLVFKRDSKWYLRGIVSVSVAKEGLNFCNPDYYVIFTDVAKYIYFIEKNLR